MKKLNNGLNLITLKPTQVSILTMNYSIMTLLFVYYLYFRYLLKIFSNFVIKILSRVDVVVVVVVVITVVATIGWPFLVKSLRGNVGCVVVRVITIGPCCLLSSNDL